MTMGSGASKRPMTPIKEEDEQLDVNNIQPRPSVARIKSVDLTKNKLTGLYIC